MQVLTRGKPWRRLAHSLLPRWRSPAIRTPRCIRGLNAIGLPARNTSKYRCRHRKLRDNLPMCFPRSRTTCGAGWRDGRQELDDASAAEIVRLSGCPRLAPKLAAAVDRQRFAGD